MDVQPKAYRFRILNAANDRMLEPATVPGQHDRRRASRSPTRAAAIRRAPLVTITPAAGDTTGMGATATATIDPATGAVTGIDLVTVGSGYTAAPIVTIAAAHQPAACTATATATLYTGDHRSGHGPAIPGAAAFPAAWTVQTLGQPGDILDGRFGGVPDPGTIGPSIDPDRHRGRLPAGAGGLATTPRSVTSGTPRTSSWATSREHNLFLGPAERADVIIDFSQFAGKTLILYNDAPAAVPAADSRLDYLHGRPGPDRHRRHRLHAAGLRPQHPHHHGVPRVGHTASRRRFNLAALQAEFATTRRPARTGVFVRDQDPIIVPQAGYNSAYDATTSPPARRPTRGSRARR